MGAKEKARRKKCNLRFSIFKKNKALQKNNMKVDVKKLLRAGMMSARTWEVHAVGRAPTERFKIEETDGSCWGQKEHDIPSFVCGGILLPSGGRALHHGSSVLGRRSLDWKMASRAKRSLDEADSGGPNVETGERACRSCDV